MPDFSTERSEGPAPSAGLLGRKERAVAAPVCLVPRPGDGGWCLPGWPPVLGVRWVGGHSWHALPVLGAAAGGCGWLQVALAGWSGPAVPVGVVGAYAEGLRQRRQRREHQVLYPDRRRGDAAFVAEVPEGGAELQRVLRRARGRGLAVGHEAGERLVPLLGVQRWAEFDDALDLARTGISLRVRDTCGHDDRLACSGYALFAAQGEVGFTRQDGESLFLAGVDVLGDDAAGHAAPVEADELPVAVVGGGGVGDLLAGGGVEEGPEAGHGAVFLRRDHRVSRGAGRVAGGLADAEDPCDQWGVDDGVGGDGVV